MCLNFISYNQITQLLEPAGGKFLISVKYCLSLNAWYNHTQHMTDILMKIEDIRAVIKQYFVNHTPFPTLDDAVLANLVLFQCANAPYFNNRSPLVLWERDPNVVQIGLLDENQSDLKQIWDPLEDHYECDFGNYYPNQIQWPSQSKPIIRQYNDVAFQLQQRAHLHCQQLQHNPEIKKLFEPTSSDILSRNTFTIEQCDRDNINKKLSEILGGTKDLELNYNDIRYHKVPSVMNKAHWEFWVAHNGDEVAGVLGGLKMSKDDYAFRLSYVSVSLAFRQQGLAKKLYAKALQYCSENQLILLRSSPGQMTREFTAITDGFDKIILASDVPHLAANAMAFENVICELKQQYDWKDFVNYVKPLCDKWLGQHPPSTNSWSINPMDKKRVCAQFKNLLCPSRDTSPPTPNEFKKA